MTPAQHKEIVELLERIANAAEQQAIKSEELRLDVKGFTSAFPVHLRDLYAMLERRR